MKTIILLAFFVTYTALVWGVVSLVAYLVQPTNRKGRVSDLEMLRTGAESIEEWSMRSCWNCNVAHEYLRKSETPFHCWDCGHVFYKGVQLSEDEAEGAERDE